MHKIATYTVLVLVSALSFNAFAAPETQPDPATSLSSAAKSPLAIKHKLLAEKNLQIVNEAKDAVAGVQQALLDLEKKDNQAALATLQDDSKKLAAFLAKNPNLSLVTAGIDVDIFDFEGDADAIKTQLKQANTLLAKGKLQSARQLLGELASEMRVTTISVPIDTFPLSINKAVELINAGKTKEAITVLDDVLNALVESTEVIPLPLLRAEVLLAEASLVEHKEDMSKEKSRAEVLKLIDAAKEKLKVAALLGYGDKEDYKTLYTAINEINGVLHSEKSAAIWAKIKQTLTDLRNKIIPSKK